MSNPSSVTVPTKPETGAYDRRTIELGFDVLAAALDDATVLDDIPNGAVLVDLPADEEDYVERAIAHGIDAVRSGRNVYFRHLPKSDGAGEE